MKTQLTVMMMLAFAMGSAAQAGGYADLVENIQDAVVNIQVTQEQKQQQSRGNNPFEQFFGSPHSRQQPQQSAGTGFVISADGYIVTNRHVVAKSTSLSVSFTSGKTYEAELVGTDDSMDIALIKVDAKNLTTLKLGDSQKMRIGEIVLALGYPLHLGFSVTSGIISGIGRDFQTGNFDVATYIQTDADITFGNSGGPLVNTDGEVIAINTMIVSQGETFGFSIPSNLFKNSVAQLREHGKVRRGALGVQITSLDEESKEYYKLENGALVSSVTRGMPAEKAGLKGGDIILGINGQSVANSSEVIAVIGSKPPGEKVELRMLSNGKESNTTLVLGDRDKLMRTRNGQIVEEPEELAGADVDSGLGFSMAPLDDEVRGLLGLDRRVKGVVIDDVAPGSLAAGKGLRSGSIVTHIDHQTVTSPKQMAAILADLKRGQAVPVRVMDFSRDYGSYSRQVRTVFLRKQ